jgi:Icc-related predicted phosphoesterase
LIIADDEGVVQTVPDVRADVLISCGDLPDRAILEVARRVGAPPVLAVKGNHDDGGPFARGIIDIHLQTRTIRGVRFGGFAGSWKYKPRGHYLFEQSDVYSALESFPNVDVFVAHNSPAGIHDKDDYVHYGFSAFAAYIADRQPRFFIHGHQHKNAESILGRTKVVGVYGHRYMVVEETNA